MAGGRRINMGPGAVGAGIGMGIANAAENYRKAKEEQAKRELEHRKLSLEERKQGVIEQQIARQRADWARQAEAFPGDEGTPLNPSGPISAAGSAGASLPSPSPEPDNTAAAMAAGSMVPGPAGGMAPPTPTGAPAAGPPPAVTSPLAAAAQSPVAQMPGQAPIAGAPMAGPPPQAAPPIATAGAAPPGVSATPAAPPEPPPPSKPGQRGLTPKQIAFVKEVARSGGNTVQAMQGFDSMNAAREKRQLEDEGRQMMSGAFKNILAAYKPDGSVDDQALLKGLVALTEANARSGHPDASALFNHLKDRNELGKIKADLVRPGGLKEVFEYQQAVARNNQLPADKRDPKLQWTWGNEQSAALTAVTSKSQVFRSMGEQVLGKLMQDLTAQAKTNAAAADALILTDKYNKAVVGTGEDDYGKRAQEWSILAHDYPRGAQLMHQMGTDPMQLADRVQAWKEKGAKIQQELATAGARTAQAGMYTALGKKAEKAAQGLAGMTPKDLKGAQDTLNREHKTLTDAVGNLAKDYQYLSASPEDQIAIKASLQAKIDENRRQFEDYGAELAKRAGTTGPQEVVKALAAPADVKAAQNRPEMKGKDPKLIHLGVEADAQKRAAPDMTDAEALARAKKALRVK